MPSGLPNNTGVFSIGKQTAKGTPQATPAYKLRYTGGFGPTPDVQTVQLAETDSSSLASGIVRTGFRVGGSTDGYVRPDEFGLIAYLTMGANADSGTTPNYTHTATHSVTPPYATIFKSINTTALVDKYVDMRIGSLSVTGAANGILTYSATWGGLSFLNGQTDPGTSPVSTSPLVYSQVTTTIGGSAPGTVSTFTINIDNAANFVDGDSGTSAVDYVPGRKRVSGSYTMLFASDADYRNWLTGSPTGTAPVTTIPVQSLTILAQVNTNLSVAFQMTNVRTNNYTVNLGTDGAPITAAVEFESANIGTVSDYLSVITKNAVASY